MNSKQLRTKARKSRENNIEGMKNSLYEEYHDYINKSHIFTRKNDDKFIGFLEEKIEIETNLGREKMVMEVSSSVIGFLVLGKISANLSFWEYFFQDINNPKLVKWCQDNEIYLTVKNKKHHYSDLLFEPRNLFRLDNIYFEWVIKADFRRHSKVYKVIRRLMSKNSYYYFRNKNKKYNQKMLQKKAKKLGLYF
ncbi:hypothetical protein LNP18_06535 [Leuconostoc citreum]|uniref:hypothetical protein n=1 Tax=Leuconostoc citreum TaxID=33964 RepID=UPI00200A8F3F|nr:hypothetical protein [Leuconostoc citreum]MCK8605761.1 hypothetical protein [Leuconostoc citreum]